MNLQNLRLSAKLRKLIKKLKKKTKSTKSNSKNNWISLMMANWIYSIFLMKTGTLKEKQVD